jgi:hypothetical protein
MYFNGLDARRSPGTYPLGGGVSCPMDSTSCMDKK